jgi:hypothetical protein
MIGQDSYISDSSRKVEDESRSKRKFPPSSELKSPVSSPLEVEAPTSDGLYLPSPSRRARRLEGDPREGVGHRGNSSHYAAPLFRAGTNIGNSIGGKFIRTVLCTVLYCTVSPFRNRLQISISAVKKRLTEACISQTDKTSC